MAAIFVGLDENDDREKKKKRKKKPCWLVDHPMTVRFIDFDLSKRIGTFFFVFWL